MATIESGTKRVDVTSRDAPTVKDDAKFHNVVEVSGSIGGVGKIFHATGSKKNSSGFIVQTAGQGVITPTEGDGVSAGDFTAKTLYEIGVKEISGACTVHVVY